MGQIQANAYFVNKVLLEHRHIHLFTYCLWMLSATIAEYNSCNIDLMARNAKNIYSLDIYRESVPTPEAQLSHLILITLFRKWGPRSPQLVSSGVRAQTSDICPPMSQGQTFRYSFPQRHKPRIKPLTLSPGAICDQPPTIIG